MIFYFSGTGNSRVVAETLARLTATTACSIQEDKVTAMPDEPIGFVFPVYGWGLPKAVRQWFLAMGNMSSEYYKGGQRYVYAVLTCGDDVGYTDRELRRLAHKQPWGRVDAIWSVRMPNTYVALPGFDIDAEALQAQKLNEAKARLATIAQCVNERQSGLADVHHGAFAWAKSYILGPLFNYFLVNDRRFKVTAACTSCGRCVRTCPLQNVALGASRRPMWRRHCTACLSCYHHCPHHAITCGLGTQKKGQYLCPVASL